MDNIILNKKITNEEEKKNDAKNLFNAIGFYLDNSLYAIDVKWIQEIIFPEKIYKVPNTNHLMLGVSNLRGNIIPIYSGRAIIKKEEPMKNENILQINDSEIFVIIIKIEGHIFGVLIDSIYRNINVTDEIYRENKFISDMSKLSLFQGVILDEDKEILVLHIEHLLKYLISVKE